MKLFSCFIFLFTSTVYAQSPLSFSNTAVHNDTWSLIKNPALNDSSNVIGLQLCNYYKIPEVTQISLIIQKKIKNSTVGFLIQNNGSSIYNTQYAGINLSKSIRFMTLGVRLGAEQFQIQEYGSTIKPIINFGGLIKLSSKLHIGNSIHNAMLSKIKNKSLPVILRSGLCYLPSKNASFQIDIDKQDNLPLALIFGTKYSVKPVSFQFSYNQTTKKIGTLVSIFFLSYQVGYTFEWKSVLGSIHGITLLHKWKK